MRVLFRTDASLYIGSGHVMRCITLARELSNAGASIEFICSALPGNLCAEIARAGFRVHEVQPPPQRDRTEARDGNAWSGADSRADAEQTAAACDKKRADWLVADHYAIGTEWERACRRLAQRLMVIDDLADRPHDCDLLLDQNYFSDMQSRYRGLVPPACATLLGPRYALLRPEFRVARNRPRNRDRSVKRILVFFAGGDPGNQTAKALEALKLLNRPDIACDVVVGQANPHRDQIAALCRQLPNAAFHCQVANMAELIWGADLGIGAAGSTTWERLTLGLQNITVTLAENQRRIAEDLDAVGGLIYLGPAAEVSVGLLHAALVEHTSMDAAVPQVPGWLRNMVDAIGASRVVDAMNAAQPATARIHARH